MNKWGKEEILSDMVRLIRTFRPDVMVCLPLSGVGGGQHHQTSGILTREAFRAAGDPRRFPEQVASGLPPWQPLKLYSRMWREVPESERDVDETKTVAMDTGRYDPVLGRSYYQMGTEARSNHRCQSMPQLRALPGEQISRWVLLESVVPIKLPEKDLFEGVEMGLGRLEDFVKGEESQAEFLYLGLERIQAALDSATAALDARSPWKTIPGLRGGLTAVRELRQQVAKSSLSAGARYELEHRLSRKEQEFAEALALAHGLGFDPIANRGEVVPGGSFLVNVQVASRSPQSVEVTEVSLETPAGWQQTAIPSKSSTSGRIEEHQKLEARFEVSVPSQASLARPYWKRNPKVDRYDLREPQFFGLPATPPAVQARLVFRSGSVEATLRKPVQYRYPGPWVGTEKQKEVSVLPRISLALSPQVLVFPVSALNKTRLVSVEAFYRGTTAGKGALRLELPSGWSASPAQSTFSFQREGEAATVKFEVTPSASVAPGSYAVQAVATLDGREYREGFQTIAYHHIQTRYLDRPSVVQVQALPLQVQPVTVGYVMGVGDDIPEAIEQLDGRLTLLSEKDLAEADLSRLDIILTGVRAYSNRKDLRAYNHRLLKYVEDGGTVVVMYNRQEWDEAQWGPYPAKISQNRITVEEAPMRLLEPGHPLFNFPNKITEADWMGWVQERGTYFLGEKDSRYRDLLASEDPWEYNKGEKRGMLVEATYGKGRWIYCGLTLFRQLPEGVPDAYKLLANLLSLPRAPR